MRRCVARPQGSQCDIGAFEFNGFIVPLLSADAGGTVNSSTGAAFVSGRITLRQCIGVTRVNKGHP